jgi:hypothetical protein
MPLPPRCGPPALHCPHARHTALPRGASCNGRVLARVLARGTDSAWSLCARARSAAGTRRPLRKPGCNSRRGRPHRGQPRAPHRQQAGRAACATRRVGRARQPATPLVARTGGARRVLWAGAAVRRPSCPSRRPATPSPPPARAARCDTRGPLRVALRSASGCDALRLLIAAGFFPQAGGRADGSASSQASFYTQLAGVPGGTSLPSTQPASQAGMGASQLPGAPPGPPARCAFQPPPRPCRGPARLLPSCWLPWSPEQRQLQR